MDIRSPGGGPHHSADQKPETNRQPAAQAHLSPKNRRIYRPSSALSWLKWAGLIIILAVVGFLGYGYIHTQHELKAAKKSPPAAQTSQQLIDKIGKLVDLPAAETPTIATVNDASKLKSQAFFADAQNGDKVLIYNHAGKAVLYRPSTNKIVEYSRVNLNGS